MPVPVPALGPAFAPGAMAASDAAELELRLSSGAVVDTVAWRGRGCEGGRWWGTVLHCARNGPLHLHG